MNRRTLLSIALFGGAGMLAGCGGTASPTASDRNGVLAVARSNGTATFLRAVEAAGLTDQLSGTGPYTLFAPTDAAFRALPPGRLNALLAPSGREDLRAVVGYHVVPGMVTSSFMDGMDVNHLTAAGGALNIDGTGGGIRVDGAGVVRRDLEADNGVVHVIDRVLTPS